MKSSGDLCPGFDSKGCQEKKYLTGTFFSLHFSPGLGVGFLLCFGLPAGPRH